MNINKMKEMFKEYTTEDLFRIDISQVWENFDEALDVDIHFTDEGKDLLAKLLLEELKKL